MTTPRSRRRSKGATSGRSSSPFVMVHWMVINSQGWHDLSLVARCAYVELSRLFDGENNGRLGMSARRLGARLRRSHPTAARALRELEDAGFITTMKVGTFKRKNRLASEYRLNVRICDVTRDPPDRRWDNQKWSDNGVTHETVQWQKSPSKPPQSPSQCHPLTCEGQIDASHSFTHDTHIESTRGDGELDARSELSVPSKRDPEGQKRGENKFGPSDDERIAAMQATERRLAAERGAQP